MDWKNYKPRPLTEDEIYELRECLHKGYYKIWRDNEYEDDERRKQNEETK
jgi:hypothetical protein